MPLTQDQLKNQNLQTHQASLQAMIQNMQQQVGQGQSAISPANQIMQKYSMPAQSISSARQQLVGPMKQTMGGAGRPVGTATGMGMTPPSQGNFNPMFNNLNRGGGMPFSRPQADGVMRKYGMRGI